jgi:predicted MPP superfamily phosphohydrolase
LKEFESCYHPLSASFPKRLAKWEKVTNYNNADIAIAGNPAIVRWTIATQNPTLCNKKIIFISDFHYLDSNRQNKRIDNLVQNIQKISPDILLLGGDLVGDAIHIKYLPKLLKKLSNLAPTTLAVLGNWERGKTWLPVKFWQQMYQENNIKLLCNESWADENFFIWGTDDTSKGHPRTPKNWPADKFNIILAHRPDTVIALDHLDYLKGASLAITGHTHGGQIRLPFIGSLITSSKYNNALDYGKFNHKNSPLSLIISSGMGELSFPWRFNCRHEAVLINFECL